ncbi:hypothetical protein H6P81_007179 [Aristolochia fimbriata]|uniref:Uncharacterized protein n=1 Tax=Aristolochia fimbriata TaxID=158543 RepID=A0AAV7EZF1_ARIFI|nr:hypothetical protein H6P81_007179 [Aristolochia fimbriata]
MKAYIKGIDEDTRLSVLQGWSHPVIVADGKTIEKLQKDWTEEEKKSSNFNAKAINAIFCGVNLEQFSRMSCIESSKEASLEIHCEGTASVRLAKLQQITTKF